MKILLIFLTLFISINLIAQDTDEDIELENLEDLSILDEFEKEELDFDVEDEEEPEESPSETVDLDDEEEEKPKKKKSKEELADEELEKDLNFLDEEPPTETSEKVAEDISKEEKEDSFKDIEIEEQALLANKEEDEDIENKYIEEFAKITDKKVEQVIKLVQEREKNRFNTFELEALRVQLEDITQSNLRLTFIPRGAKLVRLKDGNIQYTTKSITVRAYTKLDYNKDKYIVDKEGNIVFKVFYQQTGDIRAITNLYRKPHKFIRYPKKKSIIDLRDKNFPISLIVNLHGGISIPTYTRDLLDGDSSVNPLVRLDTIITSQKKKRFNLGVASQFETTSGTLLNQGTYQTYNWAMGPYFKLHDAWGEIDFIVAPKLSVFSQMTVGRANGQDVLKLSETSLLFAMEADTITDSIGRFLFGISYQRKWINGNTQGADYSISDSSRTDDSLTLYLGHRSDWIW